MTDTHTSASRSKAVHAPVFPSRAKVWGLLSLIVVGVGLLCLSAHSWDPAFAFVVTWFPNYPLFGAAVLGALRLPRFLEPVYRIEPVLYRWAGVGLVKWMVTTPTWLMLVGLNPPPESKSRHALLERIENVTKGAEICHEAAFAFASSIALLCALSGKRSSAVWILAFNIALNVYPIMLQRSIRWRVRALAATSPPNNRRSGW